MVGKIRVRRVLESLPGIASAGAGRLMADLGVAKSRRVRGLGVRQRARLLALCPRQDRALTAPHPRLL